MKISPTAALGPSAAIRNETLVLTLPDAVNPVVWQFDLSSVKASALEINPAGDHFALRLKTPRGEVHDIALYAERDRAVSILTIVHQTLIGGVANDGRGVVAAQADKNTSSNWPLAVCAFLLFVVILWGMNLVAPPIAPGSTGIDQSAAQIGVPQSADDLLQGQGP